MSDVKGERQLHVDVDVDVNVDLDVDVDVDVNVGVGVGGWRRGSVKACQSTAYEPLGGAMCVRRLCNEPNKVNMRSVSAGEGNGNGNGKWEMGMEMQKEVN